MAWHECPKCGKMFYKKSDECPYCSRKEEENKSERKTEKSYAKNQSSVEHKGHKSKKILCPDCGRKYDREFSICPYCFGKNKSEPSKAIEKPKKVSKTSESPDLKDEMILCPDCRRRFDRKYKKCPFCAEKKKAKASKAIEKSKNSSKQISLSHDAKKILLDTLYSINEGYKFIVVETKEGNSDIVVKLAEEFESSVILAANKKSEIRYNKEYQLRKKSKINLTNQKDICGKFKSIEKSEILIIDDAHRLDENILSLFSINVKLSENQKGIEKSGFKVEDLPESSSSVWIKFINCLYDDKSRIINCIKDNPENWICSYEPKYDRLSFLPLDIGNLANKYWFSKGEVCILISSTILDCKLFMEEMGLGDSQVKFITDDRALISDKNKIYARNTVDMKEINPETVANLIKEILEKHKNEKGLILRNSSQLPLKSIGDERLLLYQTYNKKLKEFNESSNAVIFTKSLEDGIEFPYEQCRFQIIVKQPNYPNNQRSQIKNKESNWYSYKQITNLIQQLQRPITSKDDYCITYILDEVIIKSITYDVLHNGFIPNYILDLIVDLDMEKGGLVCENIKKQFGVYYLFDYYPEIEKEDDEKRWSDKNKLLHYKDGPDKYLDEFNSFTKEFMKAISKLSNEIFDGKINKLALVCVPSSTPERNESATVRESIKQIEKWYAEGKAQSEFNCQKEIINCGDLLKRVEEVPTSHNSEIRANYLQHIKSIECEKRDVLEMEDVAFIIMDDVSTRGTVLNACEDILIENGVKKDNIYKLVLFKTVW